MEEARARAVAEQIGARGVRALAVACDVSNEAEVERLAERSWRDFGQVDLVFNNAGVSGGTWLLESSSVV